MNLRRLLEQRLSRALRAASGLPEVPALVVPSSRPEFGDYQANGAMAAAKALKTNPRKLAEQVVALTAGGGEGDLSDLAEKVEIAGPGFINIRLKTDWLGGELTDAAADERLGAERPDSPQTIVVDYSAPNLAKEMHVGHLRSTIIGDALARVLDFLGHKVIRQNHVGDWGTQFGMLALYYFRSLAQKGTGSSGNLNDEDAKLADLEEFYRKAKTEYDSDPGFRQRAGEMVVKLQRRDQTALQYWLWFRKASVDHMQEIYKKLGTQLSMDDIRGESDYNDDLPNVVAELASKGMLTESQGAQCVFLPEFVGKGDSRLPLIVQKSDEGYLYATTDLAAIRYRVNVLHADRILYLVGAPQSLHFRQVFAVARKAGFAPEGVALEHVSFGSMMGPDGRPFKTREGGTVKLMDLLDEAVDKALELVSRKNAEDFAAGRARPLDDQEKKTIAEAVGIGAVKYADLSQNRNSDYVFSWDKMLALEGNTAPYMQYAYARIRSIFRKGAEDTNVLSSPRLAAAARMSWPQSGTAAQGAAPAPIALTAPQERALAVLLVGFPETLAAVAAECLPNLLCSYLYDLAAAFTGFYENCPVLKSDEPLRSARLSLCDLTARTIKTGLDLLGIRTVEQM